jgi:hypothetical protein
MRTLKAALIYFAAVFGVGFVLGAIRVPVLVPRLGVRYAELLELPVMLAASFVLARLVMRRLGPFSLAQRLWTGAVALASMVAAELGLVLVIQGQSLTQYVANRDPVSGTAYVLSLIAFAFMPVFAGRGLGRAPRVPALRPLSRHGRGR